MAKNNNQKITIDGERKAILRRVDAGNFEFTGLVRRSEWESRGKAKGEILVTQRLLMGATLHVESLDGQLPTIGTLIPAALIKGRSGQFRGGDQMAAHLNSIKTSRKAERSAVRGLNAIKAAIL